MPIGIDGEETSTKLIGIKESGKQAWEEWLKQLERSGFHSTEFAQQVAFQPSASDWQLIDLMQEKKTKTIRVVALNVGLKRVMTVPEGIRTNKLLFCQNDSHVVFLH